MQKGNNLPNTTGEILLELREERGFTQTDVAGLADVSLKTYADYERNKHEISIYCLKKLADLYGVSADYILCRTNFKTPSGKDISDMTGLSDDTISALITMKQYNDSLTKESKTPPATSIDGLNLILERLYEVQEQNRKNGLSSCGMTPSVLSDIYFYINSDRVKCSTQDAVPLEDGVTNYVVSIPDIIDAHAEYNLIKHLDRLRDWYREKKS